MTLQSW